MTLTSAVPAATVVVVRPASGSGGSSGFDVLLVRRNERVAFMAGAYVFPGGRVDVDDTLTDAGLYDASAEAKSFADLNVEEERRYRVAALRELEEEAALLLARDESGVIGQAVAERVRARSRDAPGLFDVLREEGLRLTLDALIPIAHWVTPEGETRRYDTRFFLARAPVGQQAQHDAGETTELAWMTPALAIEQCRACVIMLPPPTWTILRRLSRYHTMGALFAWAQTTQIVRIQPNLVNEGSTSMLTLPGDPLYPAIAGWETPEETRFVLEEGKRWRATTAEAQALPGSAVPRERTSPRAGRP